MSQYHKGDGLKREHFWCYMGVDNETNQEYAMCDLCNRYKRDNTIITEAAYLKRYHEGKITVDGRVWDPVAKKDKIVLHYLMTKEGQNEN